LLTGISTYIKLGLKSTTYFGSPGTAEQKTKIIFIQLHTAFTGLFTLGIPGIKLLMERAKQQFRKIGRNPDDTSFTNPKD